MITNFVRGFNFRYKVLNANCKLILKNSSLKYVIDNIVEQNDTFYLFEDAEVTKSYIAGTYKYQLQDDSGILEEGDMQILQNLALMDDEEEVKSENELILEAIEAQIAGKATSAQSSMSVGDKSISYYNINDLLKLRDYFKQKVDAEKGKSAKNGVKIKYVWRER